MNNNTKTTPTSVITFWSAPKPRPMEIAIKKYANSSGSLMAVLKRTIESAPTKPKDSAKDDFT